MKTDFISVLTAIDKLGGFYTQYKDNSIGRMIHYIYHICGLQYAENVIFMGSGLINYRGELFASVNLDKGYPVFEFVNPEFNKNKKKC